METEGAELLLLRCNSKFTIDIHFVFVVLQSIMEQFSEHMVGQMVEKSQQY